MDEIDQVYTYEDANCVESRRVLGEAVTLVQDLINLYTALADCIKTSKTAPRDEIVVSSQFWGFRGKVIAISKLSRSRFRS